MSTLNLTGHPDPKLRSDPLLLQRSSSYVEPIKSALAQQGIEAGAIPSKSGSLSASDLADLSYELQNFQEESLGVNAPRPADPSASSPQARHPVRIPQSCSSRRPRSRAQPPSHQSPAIFVCFCRKRLPTSPPRANPLGTSPIPPRNPTMFSSSHTFASSCRKQPRWSTQRLLLRHPSPSRGSLAQADGPQLECTWSDDVASASHVLYPSEVTPPSSPKLASLPPPAPKSTSAPSHPDQTCSHPRLVPTRLVRHLAARCRLCRPRPGAREAPAVEARSQVVARQCSLQ